MKAYVETAFRLLITAALAGPLAGCAPRPKTMMVVDSIVAADPEGAPAGGELYSDVCLGPLPTCFVVGDNAIVTLFARAENPFTDVGRFGDIVVERYRVTYVRSDGRNVPGVEVPYAFDAATNFRVPVNTTAAHAIMVVRPQAKLEPPLSNLAGGGGALALSVLAQIDFYGRDTRGRQVAARGHLDVTFADYAEEE